MKPNTYKEAGSQETRMEWLKKKAELWTVNHAVRINGKWGEGAYCRSSCIAARSFNEIWDQVKHRAEELYGCKTYAEWKQALVPFSDTLPEECPEELKWAFGHPDQQPGSTDSQSA